MRHQLSNAEHTSIRLFIASSDEVKKERQYIAEQVRRFNQKWKDYAIDLHLHLWEAESAAMHEIRSQNRYNQLISSQTDLFILILDNELGHYSEEEYLVARKAFEEKQILKLIIYFKEPLETCGDSLTTFRKQLMREGYFFARYDHPATLWNQIRDVELPDLLQKHFDDLLKRKQVREGKALGILPLKPLHYIGRGGVTEELHCLLYQSSLLMLVNGLGGMGKTTIAAQYFYEYGWAWAYRIWLVAERGILEALLSLVDILSIKAEPEMTQKEQLGMVIKHLRLMEGPGLLMIDNVNDWEDFSEYEDYLRQLGNWQVLITSRLMEVRDVKTYYVGHLPIKKAKELFCIHYPLHDESEDDLLFEVFEQVGYNTLVIELLAKTLAFKNNKLRKHYKLRSLLEDLWDHGVLYLSFKPKVKSDYSLAYEEITASYRRQQDTVDRVVNAMYSVAGLQDQLASLLSIMALLPSQAVSLAHLERLNPSRKEMDAELIELHKRGWIELDQDVLSIHCHPIIQNIILKQQDEQLADHSLESVKQFNLLLERTDDAGTLPNLTHEEYVPFSSYAQSFIFNLLNEDREINHEVGELTLRLVEFEQFHGNTQRGIIFGNIAIDIFNSFSESFPRDTTYKMNLALAHLKLGAAYFNIGDLTTAKTYFENHLALYQQLSKQDPKAIEYKKGLSLAYHKLGTLCRDTGQVEQAKEWLELDYQISKELINTNPDHENSHNSLAYSALKLGTLYDRFDDFNRAIQFYKEAEAIATNLYEDYPQNAGYQQLLSACYSNIGELCRKHYSIEEAEVYLKKDLGLSQSLKEKMPDNAAVEHELAVSYEKLGLMYYSNGQLEEAEKYYLSSLKLRKQLREQDPDRVDFLRDLASVNSYLGILFLRLGKTIRSKEYLETYHELIGKLYKQQPDHVVTKHSYAVSYSKLGDVYLAMEDPVLAAHHYQQYNNLAEEIYKLSPTSQEYQHSYAISLEKLGDINHEIGKVDKAKAFFENLLAIREKEYQVHNDNQINNNALANIYDRLGTVYGDLGKYDLSVHYYQKAIDFYSSLLVKFQDKLTLKEGLAMSYTNLAYLFLESKSTHHGRAKELFEMVEPIWLELVAKSPKHIMYTQILENIQKDLRELKEPEA